jgi:hypothetical protein
LNIIQQLAPLFEKILKEALSKKSELTDDEKKRLKQVLDKKRRKVRIRRKGKK